MRGISWASKEARVSCLQREDYGYRKPHSGCGRSAEGRGESCTTLRTIANQLLIELEWGACTMLSGPCTKRMGCSSSMVRTLLG
jgi:hypothetical protein